MYFTGFADEAADSIQDQIRATRALGWSNIESRGIGGINIHDLPEEKFEEACAALDEAGVHINCFGSAIANWGKKINEPFDSSLAEARRAIPRMKRLGTNLIRIMSFAVLDGHEPDDQMEEERFRRLRELQTMFGDEGLVPVHENCMNYGGMSYRHTLRLLENVPGMKLVFDTGNPVFSLDRSKPKPWPQQSAWEFYEQVRDHVAYIHIKDGIWDQENKKVEFTYPGEGHGDVRRILTDMIQRGYDGGISIEPHLAVIHHDASLTSPAETRFANYVEYGKRLMEMVEGIRKSIPAV